MYGFIYVTTNLINGKKYIGKRKCVSDELDSRYLGSGKLLLQAIEKYGSENFSREIICECFDWHDMSCKEQYYIEKYDAVNSHNFYNLTPGGQGGSVIGSVAITNGTDLKFVLEDELEQFLCDGWRKGRPAQNPETIAKRAKSNRGKKRTLETREKISKSAIGRIPSREAREKMSKARLGKLSWNASKVMCVETGEVFDSLRKAATKYGVPGSASNICNCLNGKQETAFNLHWKRIDIN